MRTLRAGRRPAARRRIGRAKHALALWLACSVGTASAADSGAGQGAAAAPLKVGVGAGGGHAHAPGRADGLLLPVHPCLEHARHQRGLLGWLQRVGVQGGWRQNAGGWGGQSRRAAALRRSGWRHAHDHRRRSLRRSAPTIGLATRHSRPARAPRAPQLPPSLLCSNVDRQARKSSSDSLCGRRHGGGTHRRPLWYMWRGSPRARGSPGLTAAGVGRAQPCRPPAEAGLNPPSPPTPTGRWDSPGALGGKIFCRWDSPGRSD